MRRQAPGFSIAIISPFARERDDGERDDENSLDHEAESDGELPDYKSAHGRRCLDVRIKLCEAELAALKALRDGDEGAARRHNAEMRRYDGELAQLEGTDNGNG